MIEKYLYANFVAIFADDSKRIEARDYEPRTCALDKEHQIFLRSKMAATYRSSVVKLVSEVRNLTQIKKPHPCFLRELDNMETFDDNVCSRKDGDGVSHDESSDIFSSAAGSKSKPSSSSGKENSKDPFINAFPTASSLFKKRKASDSFVDVSEWDSVSRSFSRREKRSKSILPECPLRVLPNSSTNTHNETELTVSFN